MMKISILCSDSTHPIYPWLDRWRSEKSLEHRVELREKQQQLAGGDILFLVACHELVTESVRSKYRVALLTHASDVPEGRGWSPHVWQILEGRNEIKVTLMEVGDRVDSGAIWAQRTMRFEGHELADEINAILFEVQLELMNYAVGGLGHITPRTQDSRAATYYRKRTPDDSRLDPNKTIAEQFDLLRVCDPQRYPAFFEMRGCRFVIKIEKATDTQV